MPSLPTVGGDIGTWGTELNEYLEVAHEASGKKKEVFDVKEHGAVGDGATDDTAAFASALTAAGTAGVVLVPPDGYLVSAITVPAGVTLRAEGATITQKASTASALVTLGGVGAAVIGGTWDGNKANQTTGDAAIKLAADDCVVRNTVVRNTKSSGIEAVNVNNAWIDGNTVTASDYIGIFCEVTSASKTDLRITDNLVDRSGIAAASIVEGGLKVKGTSSFSYSRVRVSGNRVLMPVSPTDGSAVCIETTYCTAAQVIENRTAGGSMGISVAASDASTVTGNVVYNADSYGIELAGSRHSTCTGNTIDGNSNSTQGINLTQGNSVYSERSTITGNTIRGCVDDGIKVGVATLCTITGNTVYQPGGYAINLLASHGTTITGNILDGLGTGLKGIILDSSFRNPVAGNTIWNFTQHGVLIYGATAITIDNITVTGNVITASGTRVGSQLSGGAVLGTNVKVQGNIEQNDIVDLKNNVLRAVGTGTPEANVTAGVGSVYQRLDGGAATSWYIKESGTGNTGWVAK